MIQEFNHLEKNPLKRILSYLQSIKRYNIDMAVYENRIEVSDTTDGDYIKFEDIETLIDELKFYTNE